MAWPLFPELLMLWVMSAQSTSALLAILSLASSCLLHQSVHQKPFPASLCRGALSLPTSHVFRPSTFHSSPRPYALPPIRLLCVQDLRPSLQCALPPLKPSICIISAPCTSPCAEITDTPNAPAEAKKRLLELGPLKGGFWGHMFQPSALGKYINAHRGVGGLQLTS